MTNPKMMNSGRKRLKNDNYQTVDPRCVNSLLEHFPLDHKLCVDPCSPNGSGILRHLSSHGIHCFGMQNYKDAYSCSWIVSNPPYIRPLVDEIVRNVLFRLGSDDMVTDGVALLLRTNFDHAKTRQTFFGKNSMYYGQIKMLFRPRWFEKREGDKTPFHNYVWHIWTPSPINEYPIVMYSEGE